jgi:glutathione S-transferase
VAYQAHELTSLRDKPAEMLAWSPKGTVPVLVVSDGHVLEQSLDIMRWAFAQTGDTAAWWSRAQSTVNKTLLAICDGEFKQHLDRYKYPQRFSDAQGLEKHRSQAVVALLEPLEKALKDSAYLGGASPCAADIGIFPFVRQFAAIDPEWFQSLPLLAVKTWLAAWLMHPLFEAAMAKTQ